MHACTYTNNASRQTGRQWSSVSTDMNMPECQNLLSYPIKFGAPKVFPTVRTRSLGAEKYLIAKPHLPAVLKLDVASPEAELHRPLTSRVASPKGTPLPIPSRKAPPYTQPDRPVTCLTNTTITTATATTSSQPLYSHTEAQHPSIHPYAGNQIYVHDLTDNNHPGKSLPNNLYRNLSRR